MKKRLFGMALALCMILSLLPFSAAAADVVASGTCGKDGDNVKWTLDSDGLLTISGTGEMQEDESPFIGNQAVRTIVIEPGVTSLVFRMFDGCSNLKRATIPEGVEAISLSAFENCENLSDITIPSSVKVVGAWSLAGCTNLKNIYFHGTAEQWKTIRVLEGNGALEHAFVKFVTHSFGSWTVTTPATEMAEGVETRTCSVCGETETRSIPKPTPKPIENPFVDVASGDYFYDPILWALTHDPQITDGMTENTFAPGETCTRGQVVTFLWRAMGCEEPTKTDNPFSDVASGDYFYKAVLWAVEKGITDGTSDTTFSPADPCTRAHVVTFLCRAEGSPKGGSKNPFTDVAKGEYYTDAVLWAVSKGITDGTSDTTFSPADPCTRGQIVTFLYRDMK